MTTTPAMPAAVRADLRACLLAKGIPNPKNTGEPSSQGLTIGPKWVWRFALEEGVVTQGELDDALQLFAHQEILWRGLHSWPITEPAPPITIADEQHFRLLPHLEGAQLASDPQVRAACETMTMNLLRWVLARPVCAGDPKVTNHRALGLVLLELARCLKVAPVGHPAVAPILQAVENIIASIERQRSEPDASVPYFTLNPEAAKRADHGFKPCCLWQQDTITLACWELAVACGEHGNLDLASRAVTLEGLGLEIIKWCTRPDGSLVDDYGPDGSASEKGETMAPWTWAVAADLEPFAERIAAWKPDKWSQVHWSIRIALAPKVGWK